MVGRVFLVLRHQRQDRIVLQAEALVERTDILLLVCRRRVLAVLGHRDDAVQPVGGVRDRARLHAHAKDIERGMEEVEHARVVGVLHVLHVELPVRPGVLARAANVFDGLVEYAVDPGPHLGADVLGQRCHAVAEGCEYNAAVAIDAQLLQAMCLGIEIRRHARHALLATAEGDTQQITRGIEAPLVVHTSVRCRVATRLAANARATVSATVHPRSQRTLRGPRNHDRRIADKCTLKVAWVRDLGFESHEVPGGTAVDALLLPLVDRLRAEDLVWDSRTVIVGEHDRVVVHPIDRTQYLLGGMHGAYLLSVATVGIDCGPILAAPAYRVYPMSVRIACALSSFGAFDRMDEATKY